MRKNSTLALIGRAAELGCVVVRTRHGWTIMGPTPAEGQCPMWMAADETLAEMLGVAIESAEKEKGT